MRRVTATIMAFIATTPCAHAEIFKLAVPSDDGISLVWWPIVTTPPGWTHDEEASRYFAVNMLIPRGTSFADAPVVMYAKASYKPRTPDTHTVAELIQQDITEHKANVSGVVATALQPIRSGDGKALPYYRFSPPGDGAFELVAYGEEGDYFLLFVVSAQSEAALTEASRKFETMISRYSERPNKSLERSRDR